MKSLRTALVIAAALLATLPASFAEERATAGEKKSPLNILFIISDDLNTSLGCYGHPLVKSPNLDRLASRGVQFDRAYCQAPVCNPTRASLFSGLLPETVGVLDNQMPWPAQLEQSQYMPEYFRAHGYFTGTIGKVFDHGRVPQQPYWDLEIPEWGKYPEDISREDENRIRICAFRRRRFLKIPRPEEEHAIVKSIIVGVFARELRQRGRGDKSSRDQRRPQSVHGKSNT